MNITVETVSGSVYIFTEINGKKYVVKKDKWAGEVIAFQKSPIRRGKCIEMVVRRTGIYNKNTPLIEPVNTTTVKEVYGTL